MEMKLPSDALWLMTDIARDCMRSGFIYMYTRETRSTVRVYAHACHLSSRTILHPRGYLRWQRLIIL